MSEGSGDWFAEWFDRDYLKVYGHRDARDARQGVRLLIDSFAPAAGARVLDLGCGPGRHARELAAAGLRPVGLDLSAVLLAEAARRAEQPLALVRADMRWLPFRAASFPLAASFFTSFGYFDDAGNRAVLAELRRVLTPQGGLLLDYLNRTATLAALAPESSRRLGSTYVIESRRYDPGSGRLIKEIEIQDGSETRRRQESLRLYSAGELEELLREAGFTLRRVCGDLSGAAFGEAESPRAILIATVR